MRVSSAITIPLESRNPRRQDVSHATCTRRSRTGGGETRSPMNASTQVPATSDAQRQVRRLYVSLLEQQSRFDEFKYLLARYPAEDEIPVESERARASRDVLNRRIREWLLGDFDGLSAAQLLLWRSMIVDERVPASARWGEDTSATPP